MKSVSQRLTAALLVTLTSFAGCGSGRLVLPFTVDPAALAKPPHDTTQLGSHEQAIRGIAAILVSDLELPMPSAFTAYVYSGRQGFERGLVVDANVSPIRAAELSEFAVGIGKRRQLLLNDEGGTARGREWFRLIAHELAHVSQIELAQGEGRAEQWLAEGMAEHVAFQVLERLDAGSLDLHRRLAIVRVQRQPAFAHGRLYLNTLGSPRDFTLRHQREGSVETYHLTFLLADYLVERHGFDKVVEYFRRLKRQSSAAAFRSAFGYSIAMFESQALAHLQTAASASPAAGD
jgi:hypothetical protein